MQKIHLSTSLTRQKKKVWDTMLNDATYREWTSAFNPGSYYKGSWEEGSKILFLGPDQNGGAEGGMVSRIAENRLHEFISIEHLGVVQDGVEMTEGELVEQWAGVHENYTFTDKDGGTELTIDLDITEEEKANMEAMWLKALEKLKQISE